MSRRTAIALPILCIALVVGIIAIVLLVTDVGRRAPADRGDVAKDAETAVRLGPRTRAA